VDAGSIRDSPALAANRKRSDPALVMLERRCTPEQVVQLRSVQPAMLQKVVDGPRWVSRTTGLQRLPVSRKLSAGRTK